MCEPTVYMSNKQDNTPEPKAVITKEHDEFDPFSPQDRMKCFIDHWLPQIQDQHERIEFDKDRLRRCEKLKEVLTTTDDEETIRATLVETKILIPEVSKDIARALRGAGNSHAEQIKWLQESYEKMSNLKYKAVLDASHIFGPLPVCPTVQWEAQKREQRHA